MGRKTNSNKDEKIPLRLILLLPECHTYQDNAVFKFHHCIALHSFTTFAVQTGGIQVHLDECAEITRLINKKLKSVTTSSITTKIQPVNIYCDNSERPLIIEPKL